LPHSPNKWPTWTRSSLRTHKLPCLKCAKNSTRLDHDPGSRGCLTGSCGSSLLEDCPAHDRRCWLQRRPLAQEQAGQSRNSLRSCRLRHETNGLRAGSESHMRRAAREPRHDDSPRWFGRPNTRTIRPQTEDKAASAFRRQESHSVRDACSTHINAARVGCAKRSGENS
jgi:hypothetical protein